MLPDFNRLKVFYHVFNEQSSTGAAKILHITQSGVSQHLKKLEEELKTSLFTRVKRRLIPTAAGHKLYDIVQGFMIRLESGVRHINETSEKPSGLLRIGAPSEFGKTYLPRIFASFNRKYRDVSLQLELGDPNILFGMVGEGELDFAYIDILPILMDIPSQPTVYAIEPMVTEEFVLACSRKYYEKNNINEAGYDELVKLGYIGYKTDISLFRSWFSLYFDGAPSSLNLILIADSAGAIISGLEEDLGLGILVSHLISEQLAEGSLVPIRKTGKKLQNTIARVRFRDKEETVTERCFQQHFRCELNHISDLLLHSG
ncbi:MAG: LysR family transcriptional regulator [Desulfobacteraceae bacterium]|nr:LysR family transcriptional regulator [Desulfobacteraceae bacterium]